MYSNYSSDEIAYVLCKLAHNKDKGRAADVEEALYHLSLLCENEYNPDYFRTMWNVLEDILEYNPA